VHLVGYLTLNLLTPTIVALQHLKAHWAMSVSFPTKCFLTWNVQAFMRPQGRVPSYSSGWQPSPPFPLSSCLLRVAGWAIVLLPLPSPLPARRLLSLPASSPFFRSFVWSSLFRAVQCDMLLTQQHSLLQGFYVSCILLTLCRSN
jgi:hypothetical protein